RATRPPRGDAMTEDEHDYMTQLLEQFLCEREETLHPDFIDTPEEVMERMMAIANHFPVYCERFGLSLPGDFWKEQNKKFRTVIEAMAESISCFDTERN